MTAYAGTRAPSAAAATGGFAAIPDHFRHRKRKDSEYDGAD
jgi:hypothetical protein